MRARLRDMEMGGVDGRKKTPEPTQAAVRRVHKGIDEEENIRRQAPSMGFFVYMIEKQILDRLLDGRYSRHEREDQENGRQS